MQYDSFFFFQFFYWLRDKNSFAIYSLDQYKGWYDKDTNNIKSATEKHDENDASLNSFDTDKNLVERGVDMGVLFNATGEAFNLREGQGMWVSYADAVAKPQTITASNSTSTLKLTINGVSMSGELTKAQLETLTVIALKEPIRQSYLKDLRGSNAYEHVQELVEKGLISKNKDKNGRSFNLKTTAKFAEYFKLKGDAKALAKFLEIEKGVKDDRQE